VSDYAYRLGIALDEFLNTLLLNGQPNQTISYHAAVAENEGKRWGCWLCAFLAVAIQPRHCQLQLESGAAPTSAAVRAGCLLLLVTGGIGWISYALFEAALRIF
jgi:hypothetical protein